MVRLAIGFLFISLSSFAQVSLHGDIEMHADGTLYIHTPVTTWYAGSVLSDPDAPATVVFAPGTVLEDKAPETSFFASQIVTTDVNEFTYPVGHTSGRQTFAVTAATPGDVLVRLASNPTSFSTATVAGITPAPVAVWEVDSANVSAELELNWYPFNEFINLTSSIADFRLLGLSQGTWEQIPSTVEASAEITRGRIRSSEKVNLNQYAAYTFGLASEPPVLDILIAEALTPNGDGLNDTWKIQGSEQYPEAKIKVYNRRGLSVYSFEGSYANQWNGTYNNASNPLPSGSYFYQIDWDGNGNIDAQGWIYLTY